jgi:aerobic carbon-monoxide dehydrogenase large subunit
MTTPPLTTFGAGALVGAPVQRTEDPALLRGAGTYVDNLPIEGALHLAFVRSPLAHARIEGVDLTEARGMPGVVAACAADDLDLPDHVGLVQINPNMPRPALARGKVRFVGDAVAVVVAESKAQAVDAAEAVIVDYDPLDAVVDPEAALAEDAPLQFEDVGSNLVLGFRDDPEGDDPLAGADVVVRGRFENQRVACVPIECSAIAVVPGDDGDGHELTVYVGVQNAHQARDRTAALFGIDPEAVRVVAPNVGGSFGAKHWEPEYISAIRIARELGRPVKWVQTRSENLVAMAQGRGQVQYLELGLRRDGTITGLRCRIVGDCGAYAGFGGMLAVGPTRMMAQGVYRIPKLAYDVAAVTTNTTPMGAYRGAGRPEATAMLERVIDMAADELGLDPVAIRRRNLIPAGEFPFSTVTGVTYDSGDYAAALTEALRVAGYDELRAEQAARRERGDTLQLGIGVAVYVEITAPGQTTEFAEVSVDPDEPGHPGGLVTVKVGTSAHGQGHATAYAMVVADEMGVPFESIRVVQADTAAVARGHGTGGSRSMQIGGGAIVGASREVIEQARKLAADHFEAAPDDIVLEGGRFSVAGVPARSVSWPEIAAQGAANGRPLVAEHDFAQGASSFPFGAHVSVVEVDTETGRVVPVRHVAVDDCGRIINPLLVDGQVHGGVTSGISQALWEQFVYDADGNPLTSTLAEYGVPSAAEVPSYELAHTETPSPLNPLGAKGIGESGTIGSTAAVQNAVVDALSHLGVRHIDMPCTPERVWRAVEQARSGTLPDPWREPPAALADLPVRG